MVMGFCISQNEDVLMNFGAWRCVEVLLVKYAISLP
jgi:hypothetical protein